MTTQGKLIDYKNKVKRYRELYTSVTSQVNEKQKRIIKLEKERDELKERMDNLESLTDDEHTVEEWIKMWVEEADGMEEVAIKRGQELQTLKDKLKEYSKSWWVEFDDKLKELIK